MTATASTTEDVKTTPQVPHGFKRTEAGVIPSTWDLSTVGDEFKIELGKMLDAARNTGVLKPYIGNRAVQWGRIGTDNLPLVRMTRSDVQKFRLFRGDLLVCEGGEVGRAAIWNDQLPECYYQKALHRLRSKRGFDAHLMMSFLQLWAAQGHFADYVTQTSIAHLPKEKLEQVPLPVPPPDEQRAIAGALSDVDALIGSLDKLIAKKHDIKLATMQQLLTGRTRLPGFETHRGWAKTTIGDVPKDWDVRKIEEVGDIKTGPFGSSLHERDYVADGTPIITVEHLGKLGIVHSGVPMVSDFDRERLHAYVLEEGDIVFSRVGSVDRNALVRRAEAGWLFSGRLLRIRRNPSLVHAPFLSYQFHGEPFKSRVRSVAVGQTMASLNTDLLGSVEVVVPLLPEQTAIASVFTVMDAEIAALERRRNKTKAVKQGMTQALLTGRVRLV